MDMRNFANGWEIPSEGYCDQPYVVKTGDGAWLCVMTTGVGHEGATGQHVVTQRSLDCGRTWQDRADVEPADGPEASWAVLLKTPYGRIYCFYTCNGDNLREVIKADGTTTRRVDTLGWYVFKHSDDHGRSWSRERYRIPVRAFQWDRENPYGGEVRFFWNVGRPFVHEGAAYVPLHKVGSFGVGFMERSEGAFVRSENLLAERDPERIVWETLPEGDVGLRTPPGGSEVSDEQHTVVMEDGSLYCTYRGTDGYAIGAYSRDGGRTWDPHWACYEPDGRRIKNPRACPAMWKVGEGRYLRWFHNNSTQTYNNGPNAGSRNVVWLSGGVERDGFIHWSQPEIGLYVPGQLRGPSYPDLVEEGGAHYFTATQKDDARVCPIDRKLLAGLWQQDTICEVARDGLVLELSGDERVAEAPTIPPLSGKGSGLTLDLIVRFGDLESGQCLLDSRNAAGIGYAVTVSERGALRFEMCDGWNAVFWDCDREAIQAGREHHVAIIVDGGPQTLHYVVDGVVCDGGDERRLGFGRFNPTFKDISGGPELHVAPAVNGRLRRLRIYNRYLRTFEAIGNWRADLGG